MQEKNPDLEPKKKPGEFPETGKQGGGQGDIGKKGGDYGEKKGGDYGDAGKKREGVDTGEVKP